VADWAAAGVSILRRCCASRKRLFLLAGWQGDRMDMTSKLEWEPDRLLRMMLKKDAEMRQEDANKAEPSIASWRRAASSSSSLEMK
jgi:hypothetical protein